MPNEPKKPASNDQVSDLLSALANQLKQATTKPAPTNDEMCSWLLEENKRPNQFRRRVIARRRALGMDVSGSGKSSGAATTALKPKANPKSKGKK